MTIMAGSLPWEVTSPMDFFIQIIRDQDWLDEAACADMPADWFFRPETKGGGPNFWKRARAVCESCPVKAECLRWGFDTEHGMFGGTTPSERADLRNGDAA